MKMSYKSFIILNVSLLMVLISPLICLNQKEHNESTFKYELSKRSTDEKCLTVIQMNLMNYIADSKDHTYSLKSYSGFKFDQLIKFQVDTNENTRYSRQ